MRILARLGRYLLWFGILSAAWVWVDARPVIIVGFLAWPFVFRAKSSRKTRVAAGIALGIFLAIALGLKVDAYLLRHRAARLLEDMKGLELRKTTIAEALPMLHTWPELRTTPDCTVKNCLFSVALKDSLSSKKYEHLLDSGPWEFLQWVGGFFGYREAEVFARIDIKRSVVWGETFEVILNVPFAINKQGVYGLVSTVSRPYQVHDAGRKGLILQTLIHPEYILDRFEGYPAYDTFPIPYVSELIATVTPYADPSAIRHLADFNLSCITRWPSCRNAAELMPTAWAEYQKDQPRVRAAAEQLQCTPEMVKTQAGNAQAVAVVEIIGNQTVSFQGQDHAQAQVRQVEAIRGDLGLKEGFEYAFWVSPWTLASAPEDYSFTLPVGKRFILLFIWSGPNPQTPGAWPYPCGVIPWSEENLALVHTGITADARASDPN